MRTVRWMTSALALTLLLPAAGAAQMQSQSRHFTDSWFWGAKFGLMNFSTSSAGSTVAPLIGGEWLITRSRGALYLSVDQAFFSSHTQVFDNIDVPIDVNIKDLRRYTAAALAFPGVWKGVRPYAGAGFALNLIQHATLRDANEITDDDQFAFVGQQVQDQKSRISFLMMGGVQFQYRRVSVFGQASYMPSRANFLLNDRSTYFLEGGVRYNFGPASDRPK